MISCILISAGLSQRFGSPKALAPITATQTVLERTQEMLLHTKVSEVLVVLGHQSARLKPFLLNHKDIKVVYNNHYNFGQTSSVKAGLKCVSPQADAVLLLPVDYPVICGETINALVDQMESSAPPIIVPTYEGMKGHPPLFSKQCFDEILTLDNELGLNEILHRHQSQLCLHPVDDKGVLRSFNTVEEFEQIKKDFI
ncbi:NTP transferase domain-containing protein [Candidatus Omnitrophota bacterium]